MACINSFFTFHYLLLQSLFLAFMIAVYVITSGWTPLITISLYVSHALIHNSSWTKRTNKSRTNVGVNNENNKKKKHKINKNNIDNVKSSLIRNIFSILYSRNLPKQNLRASSGSRCGWVKDKPQITRA